MMEIEPEHGVKSTIEDQEISASTIFIPPSVKNHQNTLLLGRSYSHYSEIPQTLSINNNAINPPVAGTACVLGVDEAGRGPVIGPMIYGVYYLPIELQESLLATTYHFDDSKVLTPAVRANLMKLVCIKDTDLFKTSGWAIKSLSAQDIAAGMMKNGGSYNLNAQAMDATIELIRGVIDRGVNVREIYVDTIGNPAVYQKKLERIFPTIKITVEKKADSLYPCVSAASVVAKVTRDVSCEALFEAYASLQQGSSPEDAGGSWGSGYPSDSRCVAWLKDAMDPVFGWGSECRFSWGTIKDILEVKGGVSVKTDWPADVEDENIRLSQYFNGTGNSSRQTEADDLRNWFGASVGQEAF